MKVLTAFVSKKRIKNSQKQGITSADEVLNRPEYIHYSQTQMEKVKLIENTDPLEKIFSENVDKI